MNTIINILLFIVILGILVFVHELGHFLTAKKSGVFIHEFSIGMGPVLKTITGKDGIKYSIRALPIGGFVQMAGEIYEDDDTDKVPKERFMCNRPWWHRLIILVAGVFNNFLLAIILLFVIALINGAGYSTTEITSVIDGKPAAMAGLVAGDTITKINGTKVTTWEKAQILLLLKEKDNTYAITVKHSNGETETINVKPNVIKDDHGNEYNEYGITLKQEVSYKFIDRCKYAFKKFAAITEQMWLTLVNLFTGKISLNSLSGPVGIYSVVGESRSAGFSSVIYLMACLSINLGIMNILPIPALDGGHVLFLLIELITRKKINEKVESIVTIIFFGLLLLLMGYVTIHDIIKLF